MMERKLLTYECTLWDSENEPNNVLELQMFGAAQLASCAKDFQIREIRGDFRVLFPGIFLPAQVERLHFKVRASRVGSMFSGKLDPSNGSWNIFCRTSEGFHVFPLACAEEDNEYKFSSETEGQRLIQGGGFMPVQLGLLWKSTLSSTATANIGELNFKQVTVSLSYLSSPVLATRGYSNVCLLTPGVKLKDSNAATTVTFLGFELDRDTVDKSAKTLVAVLKTDSGVIKRNVFDSRRFKVLSGPNFTPRPVVLAIEPILVDVLRRKCGQQRIRGIPLLDLFHYLACGTGAEHTVAIVGGAVRDALRKQRFNDIDIVVLGCEYHSLHKYLSDFFASRGKPVNDAVLRAGGKSKKYGMIKIIADPSSDADDLDIGICKAGFHPLDQGQMGKSKTPYIFGHSFSQDAASRDYTFNAIYVDVVKGVVYDPVSGLSRDTRFDDNGRCCHTLQSCAVVTKQMQILESDLGGQFRFFKELMKEHTAFIVEAEETTAAMVRRFCETAVITDDWIRKFVKKLFGSCLDNASVREQLRRLNVVAPFLVSRARVAAARVRETLLLDQPQDTQSKNVLEHGMLLEMHLPEDQKIFLVLSELMNS